LKINEENFEVAPAPSGKRFDGRRWALTRLRWARVGNTESPQLWIKCE